MPPRWQFLAIRKDSQGRRQKKRGAKQREGHHEGGGEKTVSGGSRGHIVENTSKKGVDGQFNYNTWYTQITQILTTAAQETARAFKLETGFRAGRGGNGE